MNSPKDSGSARGALGAVERLACPYISAPGVYSPVSYSWDMVSLALVRKPFGKGAGQAVDAFVFVSFTLLQACEYRALTRKQKSKSDAPKHNTEEYQSRSN